MNTTDTMEYFAFRAAITGLATMPESWARTLCQRAGWLAGPVFGLRKDVVRRQLRAVFPTCTDNEIGALTVGVYRHLGETIAEIFGTDDARLAARVDVAPGWGGLDEAMSAGRGVLAVTAHLGNFELGGRILAERYRVLDVIKPMRNHIFGEYLAQERAAHGIATVPMAESGRAVLSHLRSGGLVTLLVDQDAGREGVRTDFLGVPASTWPGAARLAVRTGCPLVPVAILRQPDGRHKLHIAEPVDPAGLTSSEEDIMQLTARISAAVESFIWQQPEQWFWVHRRWKGAAEARSYHD